LRGGGRVSWRHTDSGGGSSHGECARRCRLLYVTASGHSTHAIGYQIQPAAESPDTAKYGHRLRRLGIYLLRTSAYAQLANAGRPTFDVSDVARHLGNPEITIALGLRQRELDLMNDLRVLRMAISSLLGGLPDNPWGSVEALAVSLSRSHPYAATLLGQTLLASGDSLEYTVLTPPPL
jgi:hypothetical protein